MGALFNHHIQKGWEAPSPKPGPLGSLRPEQASVGCTLSKPAYHSLPLGLLLRDALWWASSVVASVGPPGGWDFVLWLLTPPLPQPGPQGIRRDLTKGGVGASSRPEGERSMGESFTLTVDRGLIGLSGNSRDTWEMSGWPLFTDTKP